MTIQRHNFKWNINEILNLQREYELLGMNIKEIAKKHERTEEAILWKIDQEGFNQENYQHIQSLKPLVEKKKSDKELNQRVFNLENSISEIKLMVKSLVTLEMIQKKNNYNLKKRKPLRSLGSCKNI